VSYIENGSDSRQPGNIYIGGEEGRGRGREVGIKTGENHNRKHAMLVV
jgi:hypothetical protein